MQINNDQNRIIMEAQAIQQEMERIKNEINVLSTTFLDLGGAENTVSNLEEREAMFQVGGNFYIIGKIVSKKVLFPIGGGYYIKADKEKALQEIEKRKGSTKRLISRMQERMGNLTNMLRTLSERYGQIKKEG